MLQTSDMREIILRGIVRANVRHVAWTKNHWVSDYGAESLIQVLIAEEIYEAGGGDLGVFLEPNVSEFCDDIEAKSLEDVNIKPAFRPDICTYTRGETVPHIIEVKRRWEKGPIAQDVIRCANFVSILKNMGLEATYCAIFLHDDGARDRGHKKAFFQRADEEPLAAKKRVEELLQDWAREVLQTSNMDHSGVRIRAEVGREYGFELKTDWPTEDWMEGAECELFRWRPATIEFSRRDTD